MNKKGFAISSIIYAILILFLALIAGILGLLGNRKLILDKTKNDVINKLNNMQYTSALYKDNSGAAMPNLNTGLVAVNILDDGTVKKADITKKWYDYDLKQWANAVVLKDKSIVYQNDEIIPSSNIDGYFVWVPRYKYEIFNEGNYTSVTTVDSAPAESAAQEINIVFETKDVNPSYGTKVGEYLTHPAFTTLDVNGIWVAKFEPSGTTSDIDVLPNVTSLRSLNVKTMFELAYNYDRNLDSHMMKNTEWGAVAYLSHSKYGINQEIRLNNSSRYLTGCSATTPPETYSTSTYNGCENAYNTSIGYLASTTGNITGIYDISGGAWEYVAAHRSGTYGNSGFDAASIALYDNRYFDIYASDSNSLSFNKRILGDATGELGPFYSYKDSDGTTRSHSTWYTDHAAFVYSSAGWFARGGANYYGNVAGAFNSHRDDGTGYDRLTFRLVLS